MLWLIFLGIAAFLVWYKFIKDLDQFKKVGVNQTRPWPLVGDQWITLLKIKSMSELIVQIYNMYPKSRYVGFFQFAIPTLMLRDPELIKQITVKDFEHFTDHRPLLDPEVDPLWSKNLFSLRGQAWKEMRATLSASFTSSKMKHMFDTINETAENFAKYFLNAEQDLTEIEMKDTFTRYTNDVIATSAFGLKVDSLAEPDNLFYRMGKKLTDLRLFSTRMKFVVALVLPDLTKILKLGVFNRGAQNYFKNIINETIQAREEKGIIRQDMINLLLKVKNGIIKEDEAETVDTGFATVKESTYLDKYKTKQPKQLTNDDISSQAFIFFFAGFDTISTALCFGSYELATNPDVQDKLREEILKTHKANNGKLSYDALLKMNYMDITFTEILRKWPPVSGIDRICTKPYTIEPVNPEEKPVHIKVNDIVFLPIFGLHRDPQYYPDPEKFNPERFSDENKHSIKPYTFVPFGSGPRNCIGSRFAILEAKAVLYHLLLHFKIVPTKRTPIPLKLDPDSFQAAVKNGAWLGLERIKE